MTETKIAKKTFDYDWTNNNTVHHNYLIKSISDILKDMNTSNIDLLDIGCGNGVLTSEISKFFRHTTGIDLSGAGIEFAQELKNEKLNFENISVDEMIKRKKKFKFITSFEVIEHQYLPDDFLNKMYQLLDDNGMLLITTPYNGYIKNLIINILGKHDFHYNPLWRHGHIKFFTTRTLKMILNKCNFEVIKKSFSGRFYPISCSMIFLSKKIK
ncbi:class I SAM-dependent methyltransferase [Candidatus Pelagibacter sp.]|nr:class I SAM-dependent methyltransferase [Candidatus Pelagibacter sp.]|tara:strand:+ start:180 stop:818 length:639 start_codon:yes stop_codon:yes gene_type:complete